MPTTQLDSFTREKLSHVLRHLTRLGYKLSSIEDPRAFRAVNVESVDINGGIYGGAISFGSLWASSDYAIQNYNKYLTWVNTLNLNALAVQFCVNQVGALSMQLWYFGEYHPDAFDSFHEIWRDDINKVWSSEARHYFLT